MRSGEVALPTEQQVADLHEHLLTRHGGLPGSRVGTSIGATLGRIQTNLAYRFEEPTIAETAALAVYAFAIGHPFNDGNKRTALAIGDLILLMNEERTIDPAYQMELAKLVVELAAGNVEQSHFTEQYIEMLNRGDRQGQASPTERCQVRKEDAT